MPTSVHEYAGVLFEVDSTPADSPNDLPTLNSARTLDAAYQACGPNLIELLDLMLVPTAIDAAGNITELSPFLSVVTKELSNGYPHSTAN